MTVRLAVFCLVMIPSLASAKHSGGTDARGGHQSPSGYHFHGFNAMPYVPPTPMSFGPSMPVRTTPRVEARRTPREKPRTTARAAPEPQKAVYLFHDIKVAPYEVAAFKDGGRFWVATLAKGFEVKLQKDWIVRIEPIEDPMELRTWVDKTGKYSVVAKCIDVVTEGTKLSLELETIDARNITINAEVLSEYDEQHARKILSSVAQER